MTESEHYYQGYIDKFLLGKEAESLADFDKAVELDPDNMELRIVRAELRLFTNNYVGSIEDCNIFIELTTDIDESHDARRLRLVAYWQTSNFKELIHDYDWIVTNNFADAETYYWRGSCSQKLKNYDNAIGDFTYALEINQTHPKYLILLARSQSYTALQYYEKSLEDLHLSLQEEGLGSSMKSHVYRSCGIMNYRLGNYDEALIDFNKSLEVENQAPVTTILDYIATLPAHLSSILNPLYPLTPS